MNADLERALRAAWDAREAYLWPGPGPVLAVPYEEALPGSIEPLRVALVAALEELRRPSADMLDHRPDMASAWAHAIDEVIRHK